MATPGSWQLRSYFRKLHCHEEITVTGGRTPITEIESVKADRPGTSVLGDQEELGTCGSPTGPHAPPARERTLTSSLSRVQPRIAPSSSAGDARSGPSALRMRSTTASSSASGAG